MKRIMIISSLLLSPALFGMQMLPISNADPQEITEKQHLAQLPADVKNIILPTIVTNLIVANIEPNNFYKTGKNIRKLIKQNPWIGDLMNRENIMEYIIRVITNNMNNLDELRVAEELKDLPGMNNPKIQEWLNKRKIEIPLEDALIAAAKENNLDRVKKLLDYVDINFVNAQGKTALNAGAGNAGTEVVTELLKKGADINKPDKLGWTPLKNAANSRKLENAKLLIAAGADVNKQDNEGWTALMNTAFDPSFEILKELIRAHANLDMQSKDGATALMWAVTQYNNAEAKELLKAGANPNLHSKRFGSALKQARERGNTVIEKLLLEYGAQESQKELQ